MLIGLQCLKNKEVSHYATRGRQITVEGWG